MRSDGNAIFERCVFESNYAHEAGAVDVRNSHPRFSNCLFFHNTADGDGGGAIRVTSSTVQIQNCTIAWNTAYKGVGAGILATSSTVDVSNSVFYRNWGTPVGGQGTPSDISGATVNVRYSRVTGGYAGPGNTSASPMFVDGSFSLHPDFHLQVGSPCIDAGENAAVPAGVVLDLTHGPRFIDHPLVLDVGSGVAPLVDMGAYETHLVEHIASYCFGDGDQSPCPCSNESILGGCSNSLGVGAKLSWNGVASLTSDSIALFASNLTGSSAHFLQGTRLAQIPFSDGFWCVNGSVLHLGVVPLGPGNTAILASPSTLGGVSAPGARFYQVRYRDAVGVCAPATTNSTNGVAVMWSP
jgi:predicted outer membrane repeat protein